ncbi:acylneuraminate cytidylyltransferase family protein [Aestuariirhabdus sp. Z084]|uniref:acylneuraminate cytidylyltransferase family protein n=1 Tax=Aestuariirhabdus haliotis TaxID=2918751 RepID=UPI00201B43F4|nr:acylneuraminate cytidylyltransferase family protein [Aestuariirhabdus haliotis]MCL6415601.1 acylneuraminate cytidylyltransferase family protein [Aestuariirhabdus haliotis]MCL6419596.1 acylneuraminate cytidylyltransferase family protein [Aestuariirhabdus haliotis]
MTDIKALAIIPARGGSKGIPRKNIVPLAGKPLMLWTIEACLQSPYIRKTVVSSDDKEILSVAKQARVDALSRPAELAADETLTIPVISHVVDQLGESIDDYNYLVLMQPTSPLRTAQHLDMAFDQLLEVGASSLISVVGAEHSPLKSFVLENGTLKGIVNDSYPFMRRQDLPKTFLANGAIYIVDLKAFMCGRSLLTDFCIPFEMSKENSIDIDTVADLDRANEIISRKKLSENF